MSNPVILYILDCRHVQPGRIGVLEMECLNCNDSVHKIVDVHTFEWRTVCLTCNYRAWCGLSQILANQNATGHARKRSWHQLKVLYVENPYAAKIRDRIMEGTYVRPGTPNTGKAS